MGLSPMPEEAGIVFLAILIAIIFVVVAVLFWVFT